MIELKSFGLESHQGPHLNINEDVAEVDLINNLYMVIDGFGGSNVGDKAAGVCRDLIKRAYTKISIDPDSTLPFFYSHKYLLEGNALINAFELAHQEVNKLNESKPMDQRGGASVLAAGLSENMLTLISTGNCSAYLYRKGRLTQEVLPDSLGNLSRDSVQSHHMSIPLSGIGLFEDLHFSVREVKLTAGDIIVLLTDGACSRLLLDEVKYIVEKNNQNELELIKKLFTLSNERGNLDNQSGIVLQF